MSRRLQNKIKIGVSRGERTAANFYTVMVQMSVCDEMGMSYYRRTAPLSPRLDYSNIPFVLTEELPQDRELFMNIRVWLKTEDTFMEKSCPIIFTD